MPPASVAPLRWRPAAPSSPPPFDLAALCASAKSEVSSLPHATLSGLVRYRVPMPAEDGMCASGRLHDDPFDLLKEIHGSPPSGSPRECAILARQWVLAEAVAALTAACGAEWVGIYRSVPTPGDGGSGGEGRSLVKEAYLGAPSRALFPLTPAFAAGSNNSSVGLTGDAVLIHDTRTLSDDSPYYTCDAKVRSELCVPISARGEVIGIIDVESFTPSHFTPARVDAVLAAAAALGEWELGVRMLQE